MSTRSTVLVFTTVMLACCLLAAPSWAQIFSFKEGGTVIVKKEIFICDEARGGGASDFRCAVIYDENASPPIIIPFGPATGDLGRYVPCASVDGCLATAPDFGAGIFKEVVVIPNLSPEGIKSNLKKLHYAVTEDEVDELWDRADPCAAAGFRHNLFIQRVKLNEVLADYSVCVDYSEDCSGTIGKFEKKTCTISNYLWEGQILEPVTQP